MFISIDAANAGDVGLQKNTMLLVCFFFLYSSSLFYEIFKQQAVLNAIELQKWVSFLNCFYPLYNQAKSEQWYHVIVSFTHCLKNAICFFCHRSIWTSVDLSNSIHLVTLTRGVRVLQVMTLFFLLIQCLMNPVFPSTNTWMEVLKHEKKSNRGMKKQEH